MSDVTNLTINEYQIEGGYGPNDRVSITLQRQPQRQGADKWAIYEGKSYALSREGYWEYEPMPSSRDDDYLARCRFDTPQEAYEFYLKCKAEHTL